MSENREWYVVYTRIGFERKISEYLFRKKIESYCPVNMVVNQQGANKRISRELLFNSYVFARISENMLQQLKKINEVINFMYWQDRPAIILETDIQKIKFFLQQHYNIQLKKINVKFTAGTATPELISESEDSFQNKFVRVELPSLGYAMLAEKESTNVTTRVIPSQTRAMAPKYRYAIK